MIKIEIIFGFNKFTDTENVPNDCIEKFGYASLGMPSSREDNGW